MESPLTERLRRLKDEGHGYAKASTPDFRESLTDEERDEASAAGIGAAWSVLDLEQHEAA